MAVEAAEVITSNCGQVQDGSLVKIEICDFQKWLSRLCIAAWVMPLRRKISGCFGFTNG